MKETILRRTPLLVALVLATNVFSNFSLGLTLSSLTAQFSLWKGLQPNVPINFNEAASHSLFFKLNVTSGGLLLGLCLGSVFSLTSLVQMFELTTVLFISCIWSSAASVLSSCFSSMQVVYMFRCLHGFGLGILYPTLAIYSRLLTPAKFKHHVRILSQISLAFGLFMGVMLSFSLISVADGWRWLYSISVVFLLPITGISFFLPSEELKKQAEQETEAEVQRATAQRAASQPSSAEDASASTQNAQPSEQQDISSAVEHREELADENEMEDQSFLSRPPVRQRQAKRSFFVSPRQLCMKSVQRLAEFRDFICSKPMMDSLSIMSLITFTTELSGQLLVFYFNNYIMMKSGYSMVLSYLATVFISIFYLVATIASTLFVQRVDRRLFITFSILFTATGLFLLGFATLFYEGTLKGYFYMSFVMIIIVGSTFGISSMRPLILDEMFEEKNSKFDDKTIANIRVGVGLSNTIHWTLHFVMAFFFLPVAQYLGEGAAFWTLGATLLLNMFSLVFQLPKRPKPEVQQQNVNNIANQA